MSARPLLQRLVLPALIAGASFAAFSPALVGDFLNYDDRVNLIEHDRYRGLSPSHLRWMFTHFDGHYQPITWLSFAVDYSLWGLDPRGYHLVNLVFHCASAVLLYALLLVLLPRAPALRAARGSPALAFAAAAGALLFAVHPLRVESVAWITERKDVLFLFFALVSLLYYLRYSVRTQNGEPGTRALAASVAFFALSILSKAMVMTLPVLLLVLDAYPLGRLKRVADLPRLLREKIPFFVVMLAGMVAEVVAETLGRAFDPESNYGLADVISQPAYRLSFYWWKTLVPTDLVPVYLLPADRDPTAPIFWLCAAGVLLVTGLLVAFARRVPALLAAWLAFALMLSPTLGLVHAGYHFAADRNSYFASIAQSALVAGGLAWLWSRHAARAAAVGAAIATVCGLATLGALSYAQSQVWISSTRLWQHTIALDPENYVAQYNLAHELAEDGEYDRAIDHFSRAIWVRDEDPRAWYNRGLAWMQKGHIERAVADFDETLRREPEHWAALSNRGAARAKLGDLESAVADLSRAIELEPQRPRLYEARARARRRLGDEDGARADLERSRQLAMDAS